MDPSGKVNVLICEDIVLIADGLRESIEELGYRVTAVVSSGRDALAAARRERPDLVLMDINLGNSDWDGIETVERLNKEFKGNESLIVIYITDHIDKKTRERALPTRPANYLLKPCSDDELAVAIGLALYNKANSIVPDSVGGSLNEQHMDQPKVLNNRVFIRKKDGFHTKVELDEVLWAEAQGAYVVFYTEHKKYTVTNISLEELEKRLPQDRFARVHRSFIVAMEKVSSFNSYSIQVEGAEKFPLEEMKKSMQNLGGRIPLSSTYRDRFEQGFSLI